MGVKAFQTLEDVARKDLLGHTRLSKWAENLKTLDDQFKAEHLAAGAHNSQVMPVTVGRVTYYSAAYHYTSGGLDTSIVTSVSHPTTGVCDFVINDKWRTGMRDIYCQVNPEPTSDYRPTQAKYQVYLDSSNVLHLAVGISFRAYAGTWTPANYNFCIAIFCNPTGRQAPMTQPYAFRRNQALTALSGGVNRIIENMPRLKSAIDTTHDADGKHTVITAPKLTATLDTFAGTATTRYNVDSEWNTVSSVSVITSPNDHLRVTLGTPVSISARFCAFASAFTYPTKDDGGGNLIPVTSFPNIYSTYVVLEDPSNFSICCWANNDGTPATPLTGDSASWFPEAANNADTPAGFLVTLYYQDT